MTKDGVPVGEMNDGECFGELALLHNSLRGATVVASPGTVVYSLDRNTFRYTVASSVNSRMAEIQSALQQVPLLSDLNYQQVERLAQFVEVLNFKAGAWTVSVCVCVCV